MNIKTNEKNTILLLMGGLTLASLYLFKDYLYIILVATILTLSTSSLNSLILKYITKLNRNSKIKFISVNKSVISSIVLSFSLLLLIFFPLFYFIIYSSQLIKPYMNIEELKHIYELIIFNLEHLPSWLSFAQEYANILLINFDFKIVNIDLIKKITLAFGKMLNNINSIFIETLLILVFYFIINSSGKKIKKFVFSLLPLKLNSRNLLYLEFSSTSAVVLYSIVFTMFAQGLAFGVLMLFFDYNPWYTGMMAGFLSVIPIVGAALIYIPIVINEFINNNILGGILILIYSIVFMGIVIDNILKIVFIRYINKEFEFSYSLNELMVLLSMIAAVEVIGFWGIIVGPSILSLTFASLQLYRDIIINRKVV